ncbi:hypothetical protein ACQKJG_18480 [Priestia megaterium]|uniref:hypothetical protein n=1 Tax=Priestia megaterium TaxID=1404 RepID=UPI003D093B67
MQRISKPVKMFLVAINSENVEKSMIKYTEKGKGRKKTLQNNSLIIGVTTGTSDHEVINKMAINHDLPVGILSAFELSN